MDQPVPGECKVIVDGIDFQLARTGIARVWESVLQEWSRTDFARQITVLDRGRTPRHAGFRYRQIPPFRFADPGAVAEEPRILQEVCAEDGADVLVSTYYTFPARTPSVFLCYDMIPERLGFDLPVLEAMACECPVIACRVASIPEIAGDIAL